MNATVSNTGSALVSLADYQLLADKSLRGEALSSEEARLVLCAAPQDLDALLQDLDALLEATRRVRETYFGRAVKVCVLLNAQSGICPEDCNYCSQSKISRAPVEKYKLLPSDTIVERAQDAASTGAKRFCIVIAARGPQTRDIDHISEAVKRIKNDESTKHLEVCTSLGLMNRAQCEALKDAGVDYVNHNLNTSEEHYARICTTHTYADRVETLHNIQAAGLKTCSGGIVGMGETMEDIIELAFRLREMDIESIPVNFLLAIDGTPLGKMQPLDPDFGLRVLCLMRLLNPTKEVRVTAGREMLGRERQVKSLSAANSLFVNGYLTTPGQAAIDVREWIEAAGYHVEK